MQVVDKKILILTGVLVVGAGSVLVMDSLKKSNASSDKRVNSSITEGVKLMEADKIVIGEKDDQIVLSKGSDKKWSLSDGFPADISKILSLVEQVENSKIERLVSKTKAGFSDLGLDESTKLEISVGGKLLASLNLGDRRPKGGQYLSHGNEEQAYLVSGAINVQKDTASWEYRTLVNVDADLVKSISFNSPKMSKVIVSRDKKEDQFSINGVDEKVLTAEVKSLGSLLTNLSFTNRFSKDYVNAAQAMAKPSQVQIMLFDKTVYNVKVGSAGAEEEKHFITISVVEAVATLNGKSLNTVMSSNSFEISKHQADKFRKGRKSFLVAKKGPVANK
jgi:hypothetical protein